MSVADLLVHCILIVSGQVSKSDFGDASRSTMIGIAISDDDALLTQGMPSRKGDERALLRFGRLSRAQPFSSTKVGGS